MLKQDEKRKKERRKSSNDHSKSVEKIRKIRIHILPVENPKNYPFPLSRGREKIAAFVPPKRSIPPVIRETNPPPNRVAINAAEGGEGRFQKISSTEE